MGCRLGIEYTMKFQCWDDGRHKPRFGATLALVKSWTLLALKITFSKDLFYLSWEIILSCHNDYQKSMAVQDKCFIFLVPALRLQTELPPAPKFGLLLRKFGLFGDKFGTFRGKSSKNILSFDCLGNKLKKNPNWNFWLIFWGKKLRKYSKFGFFMVSENPRSFCGSSQFKIRCSYFE